MLVYFKSKEFFLTLFGLISAMVLGFLFIFYLFLPGYTKHGASVVVPDVQKLGFKEAINKLERAGLSVEVRDSLYMPNVASLSVIRQNPLPTSTVKPGRTIYITLNKAVPPMVKLPKIVDLSVYQAKARLESWKLQVQDIKKIPDIAKNVVLRAQYKGAEIKEGMEVPQGSGIVLIIGEGLKETFVEVPDVSGLSFDEARTKLGVAGLNINAVYDNNAGANRIYDQYPKPQGDSVKQGWPIDVFIHGKEPEGLESPLIEGQNIQE